MVCAMQRTLITALNSLGDKCCSIVCCGEVHCSEVCCGEVNLRRIRGCRVLPGYSLSFQIPSDAGQHLRQVCRGRERCRYSKSEGTGIKCRVSEGARYREEKMKIQ